MTFSITPEQLHQAKLAADSQTLEQSTSLVLQFVNTRLVELCKRLQSGNMHSPTSLDIQIPWAVTHNSPVHQDAVTRVTHDLVAAGFQATWGRVASSRDVEGYWYISIKP